MRKKVKGKGRLWVLEHCCLEACCILCQVLGSMGARGGVVVNALRYKPAGRGFDSRWCHWNFSVT